MTGKIRHSLGLLVAAAIAGLLGLALLAVEPARDLAGILFLGAFVLALVGLVRITAELIRSPERD